MTVCPMFGDECRHCSAEKSVTGVYTIVEKNPNTHLFIPKGRGRTTIELGAYCNNIGQWVRDLHYCPARWALHRGIVPIVEKPKVRRAKPKPKPKVVKKPVKRKTEKVKKRSTRIAKVAKPPVLVKRHVVHGATQLKLSV